MSSLSQFAPFAGGGIKSIQTGYVSGTAGGIVGSGEDRSYRDISVSAVSTSKTAPSFAGAASGYQSGPQAYSNDGTYGQMIITCRMTSSTNLRLASTGKTSGNAYVEIIGRWYVVESN